MAEKSNGPPIRGPGTVIRAGEWQDIDKASGSPDRSGRIPEQNALPSKTAPISLINLIESATIPFRDGGGPRIIHASRTSGKTRCLGREDMRELAHKIRSS